MEGKLGHDQGYSGMVYMWLGAVDHKHQGLGKGNNVTVSNECGEQKEG